MSLAVVAISGSSFNNSNFLKMNICLFSNFKKLFYRQEAPVLQTETRASEFVQLYSDFLQVETRSI